MRENFFMDDVISVDNVSNVVDMMQNVDFTLHNKYDQKKAGLQRSVEIVDAQNDLAEAIDDATRVVVRKREQEK